MGLQYVDGLAQILAVVFLRVVPSLGPCFEVRLVDKHRGDIVVTRDEIIVGNPIAIAGIVLPQNCEQRIWIRGKGRRQELGRFYLGG